MTTCALCGHADNPSEFTPIPAQYGIHGNQCRNHNTCHNRRKIQYIKDKFVKPKKETTMDFDNYTEPEHTEGDTYKPRDHYGNSAIIRVLEHKDSVVTANSPDGAPAIIVDLYDLNLKQVFRDVLMMTGSIVDGFKPHVGRNPIVIKWEKTVARNGRDYARPIPASEAAKAAAKAVYAAGDPFAPELGTIQASQEEAPF